MLLVEQAEQVKLVELAELDIQAELVALGLVVLAE